MKILVIGLARSGIAAANLLAKKGANITINDIKTEKELETEISLIDDRCTIKVDIKPDNLIDEMDLIVVSPGVPSNIPFFEKADKLGIPIISELELGFMFTKCPVIAITGTNGKTTTAVLLSEIFKKAGRNVFTVGNIGLPITEAADRTTKDDIMIIEVSSFQLERVKIFKPYISTILNITPDHLDRHGDMESYIAAKCRIFANQDMSDLLILNMDNDISNNLAQKAKCKVLKFTKGDSLDFGCKIISDKITYIDEKGNEFKICRPAEIRLPGQHNLENALAAVTIAMYAGISPHVVRHTLATFDGVEHRIEPCGEIGGVRFINDSKGTNIDSTIQAIRSMDRPTVLMLGGYDKQVDFNKLFIEFTGLIKNIVVYGQVKDKLIKAAEDSGFNEFIVGESFRDSVLKAYSLTKPGYNLLLSPACASYDMFEDFEKRGEVFKKIFSELSEEYGKKKIL